MLSRINSTIRALAMAGLVLPATVPAAYAGNHPLTGSRTVSGNTVFDIVVSLQDENPKGDNDAKVDAGTSDDEQNAFERRIQAFADAVYEMTNGAHKLGRVTIYKAKNKQSQADITWERDCADNNGPWANPNKYGRAGGTIHMCTNWDGDSPISDAGSGATLAHEWGHYAYGLYDEYQDGQCTPSLLNNCGSTPTATDTPVQPSIMNCQWFAVGAGGCGTTTYTGAATDFFELSTPNLDPYTAGATGSTAHKRVFGESGWSTMARDSASDPFWHFLFQAKRVYYSDLTAPVSPFAIVQNTNTAAARDQLDIKWAGDPVIQLVIDRSGSMSGTPIANAKTASAILVDQLNVGTTAIGVSSFNSSAGQDFAITQIPNPDTGVKSGAKTAIAGLRSGGGTNIGRALDAALTATQTFDASRPAIVYLLSDGQGGTSGRATTIANYRAAGATIIAFAYGTRSDEAALRAYADGTGGAFFQSPTTLAEIQSAFATANALFSSSAAVSNTDKSVAAGATDARPLQIDSTMGKLVFSVTFTGAAADVVLSLTSPTGAAVAATFSCVGTTQQICSAELDETALAGLSAGTYNLNVQNVSASAKDVLSLVSAAPKAGADIYNVSVSFEDAAYPAPMIVRAAVSADLPLTGLTVVATLTDTAGMTSQLTLLDDGKQADNMADDGTYSASIPYKADGNYNVTVQVSNPNGQAQTSYEGISITQSKTGVRSAATPRTISENFTRFASATAQATGVRIDDHADDPAASSSFATFGGCTMVTDDNTATAGRIDRAGDVDCFQFTPSSTTADLVVRATGLVDGMDPAVVVYDSIGTNQLASFNVSTSGDADNGAVFVVPAATLDASGHVFTVQHVNSSATQGGYQVSVGAVQLSDTVNRVVTPVVPDPTPDPDPAPSGGSMDLWTLYMLVMLAAGGLYVRRRHFH